MKRFIEDDRSPVSEDELREMEEKYSEHNALFGSKDDIFGSINFMNEKVFNFRIFHDTGNKPDKEKSDKSKESGKLESSEATNASTTNNSDNDNNNNDDDNNIPSVEVNDFAKDKKKFLEICEKTWDQFVFDTR
ncbi:hypothetical protein CANTEDRAFT_112799 [Yamadazyma tenuis ATCC 10573]|uniref:Uncharacterized protein n=3 Tax=Candida tenuis TaxID=2315449 RepID=G3AYT0_CANTC|nr:uncharacterized protein CANTEDRAFT_112799 [Yamadazyma tenuis ATCC 10573]EGV65920.1 hypothetical protein CANTEDRAFT_112799 [Yamadazyma tenuis ATCC 10573]